VACARHLRRDWSLTKSEPEKPDPVPCRRWRAAGDCLGAEFASTTLTVPEETVHRSAVRAARTSTVLEASAGERIHLSGR
jgi:hypothetical protein